MKIGNLPYGSLRSPEISQFSAGFSLRSNEPGFASLKAEPSIPNQRSTMARRTVLKLTRWSTAEWNIVAAAALPHGIPPLRYVREAVLEKAAQGGSRPRPVPRRKADELVHQLSRVLNNLRQLQRLAEDEWADKAVGLIGGVIELATAVTREPPERAREAKAALAKLVPAGVALNELAHRANSTETLPPDEEVRAVLAGVESAVRYCLP
jgi:hypothetical protein